MQQSLYQRVVRFLSEDFSVYAKTGGKKPLSSQFRELWSLYRYYRYVPYQYVKHGLYLKNSNGRLFDYIPPELVVRYQESVNPPAAVDRAENKTKFTRIMEDHGLPVAKHVFVIGRPGRIVDNAGNEVGFSAFADTVERIGGMIIKPIDGSQGQGVQRLTAEQGRLHSGSKILGMETFFQCLFGDTCFSEYLVQPILKQHPLLEAMNPASINTVRIDTLITDNEVSHNGAVLRVGSGNSCTDNWAAGGFIVGIDLDTGKLNHWAKTKAKYGALKIETHPVTGFRFRGAEIPFWQELKTIVTEGALALRPLRSLGWDVALTPEGPVLIEANHDHDVFLLQEGIGGLGPTPIGAEIRATYGIKPVAQPGVSWNERSKRVS